MDGFLSNPQGWNKYAYSFNNPLKYVDPDGKWAILAQLLQRAANSPMGQRVINYASTQGARLFNAATQFINSPAGQEITQGVAETALGYQRPSFSPLRTAEKIGLKGAIESGGWVYGNLANGAEVAATFGKTGDNLAVNVIGVFNPDNAKGLTSIQEIFSGAFDAARSEGAQSLTVRP